MQFIFQYQKNQDRMNLILLRNTQGLHAPLRIAMELKATEKIGRLPFLPSSSVMRDVLLGKDQDIGYKFYNNIFLTDKSILNNS